MERPALVVGVGGEPRRDRAQAGRRLDRGQPLGRAHVRVPGHEDVARAPVEAGDVLDRVVAVGALLEVRVELALRLAAPAHVLRHDGEPARGGDARLREDVDLLDLLGVRRSHHDRRDRIATGRAPHVRVCERAVAKRDRDVALEQHPFDVNHGFLPFRRHSRGRSRRASREPRPPRRCPRRRRSRRRSRRARGPRSDRCSPCVTPPSMPTATGLDPTSARTRSRRCGVVPICDCPGQPGLTARSSTSSTSSRSGSSVSIGVPGLSATPRTTSAPGEALEHAVRVVRRLDVERDDAGAGRDVLLDGRQRVGHHQMDVRDGHLGDGGDERGASGQAGAEHAVDDVDVRQADARRGDLVELVAEVQEVGAHDADAQARRAAEQRGLKRAQLVWASARPSRSSR